MKMPGEMKVNVEEPNFKDKCRSLKRKLRFLIYEQECFQEELRKNQRKLLKLSRDKNFLLDRLLRYERVVFSGSDSESTESSEDEKEKETNKKPNQPGGSTDKPEKSEKAEKLKKKAKRRPDKKLQTNPNIRQVKKVLPVKLQSPPNSLKQQMPQLVEMLNRASKGATMDASSSEPFEGLPYTPAFAFPPLAHQGVPPSSMEHTLPPRSVLPSLLMSQPAFPSSSIIRKHHLSSDKSTSKPPSRKKPKKTTAEKQASSTSGKTDTPVTSSKSQSTMPKNIPESQTKTVQEPVVKVKAEPPSSTEN